MRTAEGKRLQVKARVVTRVDVPGERQLSVFRSFDFDDAAVVLFDASYAVRRAALVPAELARAHSSYRAHVNGHVLMARDALFSEAGVRDVTALVAGHAAAQPAPVSTR